MRLMLAMLLVLVGAAPVRAQDFAPPEEDTPPSTIRVGIFGFGSRVGASFGRGNQGVASATLDVADIYSEQVRLRPSAEFGFGGAVTTYVVNIEVMYRFASDAERAVPYVGGGIGIYGQQACGTAPTCPRIWPQFAMGFEIRFRDGFNWLFEYHGEDALRRHRFFVGLATRRR